MTWTTCDWGNTNESTTFAKYKTFKTTKIKMCRQVINSIKPLLGCNSNGVAKYENNWRWMAINTLRQHVWTSEEACKGKKFFKYLENKKVKLFKYYQLQVLMTIVEAQENDLVISAFLCFYLLLLALLQLI